MNSFSRLKDMKMSFYKKNWKRYGQFFLGCVIVALSYNLFIAPNSIVPGGVGGIAVIVNNLFGIENSLTILILNIFLLILSYFLLGKEKTRATLLGSLLFPLLIKGTEYLSVWIVFDTSKVLLMTMVGGIVFGTGAGLIFKAGFTTGGTDIINQIISKYGKISMGKSMLLSDGIIVLSSGVFFGLTSMLYSILVLYMISLMADRIVLGISNNKMFYIITNKEDEIKKHILDELKLGATIIKAKGGMKENQKNVIMTILPTKNFYILKNGIEEIDKDAFFIVTDAYEMFGGE